MNLSARLSNTKYLEHVIARAIICGSLLVLPSCGIPELRPALPGPDLPASYSGQPNSGASSTAATSSGNSVQLGIEEFYNDQVLSRLIDQALVNNRELKILEEEVQIARAEVKARQGAYLPFVTAAASAGIDKYSNFTPEGASLRDDPYAPGKFFPNPVPNYLLGFNFFWSIDLWRELHNARESAAQRYLAATERRNFFVTHMVAEVAENYYGLMALDKRMEALDKIIELQEQSFKIAKDKKEAGKGTELGVQRFQAEVRKNQSEKLIVKQEIVEVENKINFLLNRYPQPVERISTGFFDLNIQALNVGLPAQLLEYRPDIRQAERELMAAGLDIKVARAHFFPKTDITSNVGYEAFNPRYLFWSPDAIVAGVAGDLVAPIINKKAIQAEYQGANAKQLEAVYNYQRVILNAYTEVVNRVSMAENYAKSIVVKKQQLESLEASVDVASKLFDNARAEYSEVLFAQRDLLEARMVLIQTKKEQLSAVVNAYQALGGGLLMRSTQQVPQLPPLPQVPQLPQPQVPQMPQPKPLP
jgi:multidrug efflux system outer membrane protein